MSTESAMTIVLVIGLTLIAITVWGFAKPHAQTPSPDASEPPTSPPLALNVPMPPMPNHVVADSLPPHRPRSSAGSQSACVGLGLLLLLVGAYFLIVNPSEGGAEMLGRDVVNLQRLYLGQTAAICGAVFLAAGLRPRSI
jgi:hypothetical protein